jgi:hypothetical protein
MMPRSNSEDSEPILEVAAIGTANADGEFLQHEAVAPQKPHAINVDPQTVIVRDGESMQARSRSDRSASHIDSGLADAVTAEDEVTSATKSRHRQAQMNLYRVLRFVENHPLATVTLVVGALLLMLAGVLALR